VIPETVTAQIGDIHLDDARLDGAAHDPHGER
jgi:hypothetical protein